MDRLLFHSVGHFPGKFRTVTDAEKRRIMMVFCDCDYGSKGYLCREDLKIAVVTLFGYKPSKYEVDQMMKGCKDTEGITEKQFLSLMSSKMAAQDRDEEIRHIFMTFDTHCRGFITIDDLRRAFSEVAPHIPRHRVESLFREVDRDGDGRVGYLDFEFMMKYSLEDGF
ncbi:EF-hand calcium-binding domain-containing protein 11-like [Acanthaster planci]|uniref:EF-hand calcium-binding domain-containing protein 11-like n=1 Tax=Acanthaster planci TaxID=133434 RepID=A0A8B7Z1B0_ACAPL|nr:EF-hand calcium-binding domain-containing protein 11-like [Acanthaster planci]XP_022099390.1 EF-hand calcium-binding domain-containing protein 11-like [Acanthaster planci]XP_022099391.1 EF-hand calcium-binding domain-containing protein 11-like [Acanthaster planci]